MSWRQFATDVGNTKHQALKGSPFPFINGGDKNRSQLWHRQKWRGQLQASVGIAGLAVSAAAVVSCAKTNPEDPRFSVSRSSRLLPRIGTI
jgi:hypothetical protein